MSWGGLILKIQVEWIQQTAHNQILYSCLTVRNLVSQVHGRHQHCYKKPALSERASGPISQYAYSQQQPLMIHAAHSSSYANHIQPTLDMLVPPVSGRLDSARVTFRAFHCTTLAQTAIASRVFAPNSQKGKTHHYGGPT